jgi:hydroxymethylbilane synthase
MERLGLAVTTETISTRGDVVTSVPISGMGGDGVFVRELERALLEGRIDAAVHSLKDLPTAPTPGLTLACIPLRATPFDVLVGRDYPTLKEMPPGAIIGTASIRRVMQVRSLRPDLVVRPIRGNVDTRLRLLDEGAYDGLVLAGAGLQRLGLAGRITQTLQPDAFWPAVAQGALVIQVREDDLPVRQAIMPLDDAASHRAVLAERSCLAALAGGCLAPIGGWARDTADGRLELGACVLEETAGEISRIVAESVAYEGESAAALGCRVAADLVRQGANDMLERIRGG